ncbi:hypothetical protein F2Q70_00039736 [Brassica cretica]|uniref:Aconitase/3-isopropylmalate dehydratase large subunit alpha/beta/alpha domain-containing protein n=1 Tax=Brassica cretica TaxID=69181 RepID=A0A8S9K439_BRACR|nr:hypothetical protein F2Q70_00039736 [Brassica cretica]
MYRRATSGVRSASTSLARLSSSSLSKVASAPSASVLNQTSRSRSFSSALRSYRVCSASTRWSHGGSWRSPASLRAQARVSAPVMERLERRYASMASEHTYKDILTSLPKPGGGEYGKYYSLPALNDPRIDKLPYSVRILLESAIRNCDNYQVTKDDVEKILDWENTSTKQVEIAFKPARVILQVINQRKLVKKQINQGSRNMNQRLLLQNHPNQSGKVTLVKWGFGKGSSSV